MNVFLVEMSPAENQGRSRAVKKVKAENGGAFGKFSSTDYYIINGSINFRFNYCAIVCFCQIFTPYFRLNY